MSANHCAVLCYAVLCCVTKIEGATSELIVIVRMVHS